MLNRFAIAVLALPAWPGQRWPIPPRPRHRHARCAAAAMFPMQGGQAIYEGVCQGCHMPDAKGAVGAGMYPALASNPKLEDRRLSRRHRHERPEGDAGAGIAISPTRRSPMW